MIDIKTEILSFSKLENNWDCYGAVPTNSIICEKANSFIDKIGEWKDKITDVFPNPHGTLNIEWINDKGEKASLEIGLSGYSYFVKRIDKEVILVDSKNNIVDNYDTFLENLKTLF